MTTTITQSRSGTGRSLADLVERLGGVPLTRIRRYPAPGTATEDDLIFNNDVAKDARCELIDGVLVEKAAMSHFEDLLATILITELQHYVRRNRIAKVISDHHPRVVSRSGSGVMANRNTLRPSAADDHHG
jgi:hypothetical protein